MPLKEKNMTKIPQELQPLSTFIDVDEMVNIKKAA